MSKKKFGIYKKLMLFILCIICILFVFPFYWIITGAFKMQKVAVALPPQWFPKNPTLDNFRELFINPAARWFVNSVVMALVTMVLVCVTASMAGYAIAKKKFTGRVVIFAILISAMALPKQVVLVPLVRIMNFLGLYDSLWAVILPTVGWPFGTFLMKQFSENIPSEILESAKIDGAGELRTFIEIVLPLIKPALGALSIFTFIGVWNDYFLQLVMLSSRANLSISLGVATLQAEFSTNYGVIMAGAALGAVPIVTIFLLFQDYFTTGITMGAVKG